MDIPDSESSSSAGKCPVDHKNPSSLWKVLGVGATFPFSPQSNEEKDNALRTPASLEEAAKHAQSPHPEQRLPLSTFRTESSIPRGNESPNHQLGSNSSRWVYPSEQQVFNAMKRKGWEGIEEEAIPSFLQVHNSVNERSWREVCMWENQDRSKIELVRFEGRPKDLSPKAWFWSTFLFQDKPFDRHDWYINNGVDHEKRYVLDFYMVENKVLGMPRVDIDVRPALDTPKAFLQRGIRMLKETFPGITREMERMNQRSSQDS